MNVLFDMETGDPDDLITLILLLLNPQVKLQGVTCYQGSPIQIGLINHVLKIAGKDILTGGLNENEPQELSPYYKSVVGTWDSEKAVLSPLEVFKEVFSQYPDTQVLTGAPLTNIAFILQNSDIKIEKMVTQGGYIGSLAKNPLEKFKGRQAIRTYNLTNDVSAFTIVNESNAIKDLTFVTKDLCHGFLYTPEYHHILQFGTNPLQQLLKKCLEHYALNGKSKALHDPLAMIYMLSNEIGQRESICMSYKVDKNNHNVFSSQKSEYSSRYALVDYDSNQAWNILKYIAEIDIKPKLKK